MKFIRFAKTIEFPDTWMIEWYKDIEESWWRYELFIEILMNDEVSRKDINAIESSIVKMKFKFWIFISNLYFKLWVVRGIEMSISDWHVDFYATEPVVFWQIIPKQV